MKGKAKKVKDEKELRVYVGLYHYVYAVFDRS